MVGIVELLVSAAVVVKATMHLKALFRPRELHPLELGIALIEHLGEGLAEIHVGPADIRNRRLPFRLALRKLENPQQPVRNFLHILSGKGGPWRHGPNLTRNTHDIHHIQFRAGLQVQLLLAIAEEQMVPMTYRLLLWMCDLASPPGILKYLRFNGATNRRRGAEPGELPNSRLFPRNRKKP